jgi:prepilin-type N-terminal cleavage/methylation domain-containing protein
MTHERADNRGFTLVETMVAITILAVAMIGPFAAIQNSLNASRTARDQLIAISLAQEGIEYVRSIRDNNYLSGYVASGGYWLHGFESCQNGATCLVDPAFDAITACSGSSCRALNVETNASAALSYAYNQQAPSATNVASPFTRTVQILPVSGSDHEVRALVTVTWTSAHRARSLQVSENIQNWL